MIRSRPSPRAWEVDETGRNGACGSHSVRKMQFSRWLCIVEGSAKLFPGASGSPLKVPKNKFVCKFKSKVRIKQFLTCPSSVPDIALVSVRRWRPSDGDYSVPFGCCLNSSAMQRPTEAAKLRLPMILYSAVSLMSSSSYSFWSKT